MALWHERHAAEQQKAARRDAKYKKDCAYGYDGLKKLSTKKVTDMVTQEMLPGKGKLTDPSKSLFKSSAKKERQGFRSQ